MDYSQVIKYAMESGKYAVIYYSKNWNQYFFQFGSDNVEEVEEYYQGVVDLSDATGRYMFVEDTERGIYNRDTDTFFLPL